MISRILITCLACQKPNTARVQVGHEAEQSVSFPCAHCGTDMRLKLLLNDPPHVKIVFEENCEEGSVEGIVTNVGAGFTIDKNNLHSDLYFPSFDLMKENIKAMAAAVEDIELNIDEAGPVIFDTAIALGGLPRAIEYWKFLKQALRFHNTRQYALMEAQLNKFWELAEDETFIGWTEVDKSLENTLLLFFQRIMQPSNKKWLDPLVDTLQRAAAINTNEVKKLSSHYDLDLKSERFESYSEIFSEYFKAYGEFNQTLLYVRQEQKMDAEKVATSTNFDQTKMFYGNAFEVLGSHLDFPAAINNILSGRPYDQMEKMDLKQYRTINKANRTTCFASSPELSWLVSEYDSTVRNASHHRWFKLNNERTEITYRSGGTGAVHKISYAEYLYRCNKLSMQLMSLACIELWLIKAMGKSL